MKRRKNEFLTFIFSCLPGAGHMYLGFFKRGVSLMSLFFLLIALIESSWLNLDILQFAAPVVWFYAFFDALNINSLTEEELNRREDHFLWFQDFEDFRGVPFAKYRNIFAILIILLGCHLLFDNILDIFEILGFELSYTAYQIIFRDIPQCAVGIVIIALGVYLIRGKKAAIETPGLPDHNGGDM